MLKGTVALVIGRTLPALAACMFSALLVYVELIVRGQCGEGGFVEYMQAIILLVVALLCAILAKRRTDLRGGMTLAFGLFATMFIRENDQLLDNVFHGFWIIPALAAFVVSVVIAWRAKETILPSIRKVCESVYYPLFAVGFFVTVVFSRIFGMKAIWMIAVGHDDYRQAKHVAEEGCELLGYSMMLLWAILFVRSILRERCEQGETTLGARPSGTDASVS